MECQSLLGLAWRSFQFASFNSVVRIWQEIEVENEAVGSLAGWRIVGRRIEYLEGRRDDDGSTAASRLDIIVQDGIEGAIVLDIFR
jgi:hypothetical protein